MNGKQLIWTGVLAVGLGTLLNAQDAAPPPDNQRPPSDQGAKSDIKGAGHDTARAAKKTGRKIKRGTKKGVHKAAHKTRQGADKVEDKTETPPQR